MSPEFKHLEAEPDADLANRSLANLLVDAAKHCGEHLAAAISEIPKEEAQTIILSILTAYQKAHGPQKVAA